MPEEVTVNGKRCIEYTITELEAIRLAKQTQEQLKRGGGFRTKVNPFLSPQSINSTGRKHRHI
jgi:predicted DNA-binding protein (UPF0251 family)